MKFLTNLHKLLKIFCNLVIDAAVPPELQNQALTLLYLNFLLVMLEQHRHQERHFASLFF
jgi:hypothetical protein